MKYFLFMLSLVIMLSPSAFASCDGTESPFDMAVCTSGVEESEMELAAAHGRLLAAMPKRARPNAQQEQVTWFTFRNSVCDREGEGKKTEEEKVHAMILCTAKMNRERAAMLDESREKLKP